MNRIVELALAVIGAVLGAVIMGGIVAVVGGAVAGFVIGMMGSTAARRMDPLPSVHLDNRQLKEIESALQMGIAAGWAIKPIYDANFFGQRDFHLEIHEKIVVPYTSTVTPHTSHLFDQLVAAMGSGIRPDAAMAHIKRRYGPRFMRKDASALVAIATTVLRIQATHGNITESREWFGEWCKRIGIGEQADALWDKEIGDREEVTMAELTQAMREENWRLIDEENERAALAGTPQGV